MEEQKPKYVFFLAPTNILKINYDRETNLTYIYIVENKGRTNADLVVYEFDINNVMNTSDDPIAPIDELLKEFYIKNYETLESISNKTKIGRFNEEKLNKFLSFNDIYGFHNMTEVKESIHENCMERVMLRKENFQDEYLERIVKSIRGDNFFDTHKNPVDTHWIENNTIFKKVEIGHLDERLKLSDSFKDDLLIDKEEELFISYKELCKILFDTDYYLTLREVDEEEKERQLLSDRIE